VRSILYNKLDRQAAQRPPANGVPILVATLIFLWAER
jgi:hypothetical protein